MRTYKPRRNAIRQEEAIISAWMMICWVIQLAALDELPEFHLLFLNGRVSLKRKWEPNTNRTLCLEVVKQIIYRFPYYFWITWKLFGSLVQVAYWVFVWNGLRRDASYMDTFVRVYWIISSLSVHCSTEECSHLIPNISGIEPNWLERWYEKIWMILWNFMIFHA